MSELSQLERALRFALRFKGTLPECPLVLWQDALLDAQACAIEFERLVIEAAKRADHAREIGKKGGRPKKKRPSKATLAKRKSRAKQRGVAGE